MQKETKKKIIATTAGLGTAAVTFVSSRLLKGRKKIKKAGRNLKEAKVKLKENDAQLKSAKKIVESDKVASDKASAAHFKKTKQEAVNADKGRKSTKSNYNKGVRDTGISKKVKDIDAIEKNEIELGRLKSKRKNTNERIKSKESAIKKNVSLINKNTEILGKSINPKYDYSGRAEHEALSSDWGRKMAKSTRDQIKRKDALVSGNNRRQKRKESLEKRNSELKKTDYGDTRSDNWARLQSARTKRSKAHKNVKSARKELWTTVKNVIKGK